MDIAGRNESSDMKDSRIPEESKSSGADAFDIRVARIEYNPAPDAQDRLRRLFTILLKLSSSHEQAAFEKHPPIDDHPETES